MFLESKRHPSRSQKSKSLAEASGMGQREGTRGSQGNTTALERADMKYCRYELGAGDRLWAPRART